MGLGRPCNPWFDHPRCAPQLWPSPPRRLATGEVELETAAGIVLIDRDPRCSRCLFLASAACQAGRQAGLINELAFTRGGRADENARRARAIDATGPADPVAMGGRHDTHRIPNSTNRQIVCCQNETPQTPCDPRGSLCNQHRHLCYTKMTCGLVSSQTNSLEQTVYLN